MDDTAIAGIVRLINDYIPFGIQVSSLLTSAFAELLTGMTQKSKKGPKLLFVTFE